MKTQIASLLAAALLAPMVAHAQTPERPRRDRARTFLVVRLAEQLDLSDEKALQVSAILRRSEDHRSDLAAKRDQLEKQLRAALDKSPRDDGEMSKLVGQANDLDLQLSQIVENDYREIQKNLTVEQQARLVLFRPQLRRQIRGALRQRLKGADGGQRSHHDDD